MTLPSFRIVSLRFCFSNLARSTTSNLRGVWTPPSSRSRRRLKSRSVQPGATIAMSTSERAPPLAPPARAEENNFFRLPESENDVTNPVQQVFVKRHTDDDTNMKTGVTSFSFFRPMSGRMVHFGFSAGGGQSSGRGFLRASPRTVRARSMYSFSVIPK